MSSGGGYCPRCGKPVPMGSAFCPACGAALAPNQSAPQGPLSGVDVVLKETEAQSHWIRRIIAFLVDAIIVYVVIGILAVLFSIPFLLASGPLALGVVLAGTFSFVAGVLLVLYFTFAEAYTGATFGKRIFGLKVVAAGGKYPTVGQSIIRNISKIYWLLLLLDVIVGLATTKRYTQKFSDRFAGTEVVEAARSF